jgi:hypothetical protein
MNHRLLTNRPSPWFSRFPHSTVPETEAHPDGVQPVAVAQTRAGFWKEPLRRRRREEATRPDAVVVGNSSESRFSEPSIAEYMPFQVNNSTLDRRQFSLRNTVKMIWQPFSNFTYWLKKIEQNVKAQRPTCNGEGSLVQPYSQVSTMKNTQIFLNPLLTLRPYLWHWKLIVQFDFHLNNLKK